MKKKGAQLFFNQNKSNIFAVRLNKKRKYHLLTNI